MPFTPLPVPPHFAPAKVPQVWRVPYQRRAGEARQWADRHEIGPSAQDRFRILLLLVDVQNTFCIPGFELFVGGSSGTAAVDDNRRLCDFIYRNLGHITEIVATLDAHRPLQIFHSIFWIDARGEHPPPFTVIDPDAIAAGTWRINPCIADHLGICQDYARRYLAHYAAELAKGGKYDLTVWPYHAMQGGIGHALVSSVEEAVFFHGVARCTQPDFQLKGDLPLTEHYSVLQPEVRTDMDGRPMAEKRAGLVEKAMGFDACVIAGQAKSHCVAWTVADLLAEIEIRQPQMTERFYLLEDCTSPVVVPGVADYTAAADAAFRRFAEAGMHRVRSTDPMDAWPGM